MKTSQAAADDLMTAVDAARILGLSVDMVRRLAKDGRLPFMSTIRGVRLFRRGNVEQLAQERASGDNRKGSSQPVRRKTDPSGTGTAMSFSRRVR